MNPITKKEELALHRALRINQEKKALFLSLEQDLISHYRSLMAKHAYNSAEYKRLKEELQSKLDQAHKTIYE